MAEFQSRGRESCHGMLKGVAEIRNSAWLAGHFPSKDAMKFGRHSVGFGIVNKVQLAETGQAASFNSRRTTNRNDAA
jgi:hypothetical protein